MKKLGQLYRILRAPLFGFLCTLVVSALLLVSTGESPYLLLQALRETFFTGFGLGYTLYYMTPLLFTGLAVAVSFQTGLFNIGAEGQLYVGSMGVVLASVLFPNVPFYVGVPLGILFAAMAGAVWGGIAGGLKAWRGSHEVIVTILLNFIAISLVDYLILYPFKSHETQNTETVAIASGYVIPTLTQLLEPLGIASLKATPANSALFLGIFAAVVCWLILYRTVWGFELRAVGHSPIAARFNGISVAKNTVLSLAMSGALAGLVGVNEVMGSEHKLLQGFSPGYGFTGIAVALLARNHPLGILLSAFLFGGLHNSARTLEFLSDHLTKELALVMEGVLIAFVASDYLIGRWLEHRRRKERST